MKQDSEFWDGLIERGKMFLEGRCLVNSNCRHPRACPEDLTTQAATFDFAYCINRHQILGTSPSMTISPPSTAAA